MGDFSALGSLDGHDHFHGLDFNERSPGFYAGSVVLQIADYLSGNISTKFRRIKDGRPAKKIMSAKNSKLNGESKAPSRTYMRIVTPSTTRRRPKGSSIPKIRWVSPPKVARMAPSAVCVTRASMTFPATVRR